MSPWAPKEDTDRVYRELISRLPLGLTMIALHPTQSGEIESIVPAKAHFRTEEYRLLKDPDFQNFVAAQDIRFIGFRPYAICCETKVTLFSSYAPCALRFAF
jgi:hypothetical protein